jgi:hypothetical protein
MTDVLKSLFETSGISEEIKADIERAWDQKVTENKETVTKQLREEFAQRYEHDKSLIVEAVDAMLSEHLKEEIAQFIDDRKQLAEQKAKYAIKMKKDSGVMKEFVTRQLSTEVKELREDHRLMTSNFSKLEEFVVEALAQEIAEFYTDKQDVSDTKVRLVREGKQALATVKEQFIKRAAKLVESTVEKSLKTEMTQLREDIEHARQYEFGRKLFEAFASEYQTSYLNEKSDTTKLLKIIDRKNQEIMEAKEKVKDAIQIIEQKDSQVKTLKESTQRQEIMHELLSPLSSENKGIMAELLESVQTSKLRNSFDKYLPAVISGTSSSPKKQTLNESVEVTGNKVDSTIGRQPDANIIDIRRLAGLKQI